MNEVVELLLCTISRICNEEGVRVIDIQNIYMEVRDSINNTAVESIKAIRSGHSKEIRNAVHILKNDGWDVNYPGNTIMGLKAAKDLHDLFEMIFTSNYARAEIFTRFGRG